MIQHTTRVVAVLLLLTGLATTSPVVAEAQTTTTATATATSSPDLATATATTVATSNAFTSFGEGVFPFNFADRTLTRPADLDDRAEAEDLFADRLVTEPNLWNFIAYSVQEAVRSGVPANTIFLILLTPFLAFFVSFVRVVVGLPTLDMLVPIALAFTLLAVGITVGLFVLSAILLASFIAKKSLSKLRIMFYPKRSLSMVFLAVAVFLALTLGVQLGVEQIIDVSIFPLLILILLGDMIISVQLHKSASETTVITGTTIFIGLVGYAAATSRVIQDVVILYPEIFLLVIPANIIVGRYFGLRILELFRFEHVARKT